jgi:hypothetical protein
MRAGLLKEFDGKVLQESNLEEGATGIEPEAAVSCSKPLPPGLLGRIYTSRTIHTGMQLASCLESACIAKYHADK